MNCRNFVIQLFYNLSLYKYFYQKSSVRWTNRKMSHLNRISKLNTSVEFLLVNINYN